MLAGNDPFLVKFGPKGTAPIVSGDLLVLSAVVYVPSILSDDCSLDSEIEHRIKATSSAFGRELHRVFLNHNFAIPTKMVVCVSAMAAKHGPLSDDTLRPLRLSIFAVQTILGVR